MARTATFAALKGNRMSEQVEQVATFARPEAFILQCKASFGTLSLSMEINEDTGQWEAWTNVFDEDGHLTDRVRDGGPEDAGCPMEAGIVLGVMALTIEEDYNRKFGLDNLGGEAA
jgi:hypothetical protein